MLIPPSDRPILQNRSRFSTKSSPSHTLRSLLPPTLLLSGPTHQDLHDPRFSEQQLPSPRLLLPIPRLFPTRHLSRPPTLRLLRIQRRPQLRPQPSPPASTPPGKPSPTSPPSRRTLIRIHLPSEDSFARSRSKHARELPASRLDVRAPSPRSTRGSGCMRGRG